MSGSAALLEALTLALKRVSPDRLECAFVANPLTCCFPQGEGGAKLSSNSDVEGAPEDVDSELGGMSSEDECTDEEKEEEEEDVEMSSLDSSLGQNVEEKQAWIQPLLLPFEDLCQESASQQVFVVHHNFGNEDLESDFHLRFVVPVVWSRSQTLYAHLPTHETTSHEYSHSCTRCPGRMKGHITKCVHACSPLLGEDTNTNFRPRANVYALVYKGLGDSRKPTPFE